MPSKKKTPKPIANPQSGNSAASKRIAPHAIYNVDDRIEVKDIPDLARAAAARGVGALVNANRMFQAGNWIQLRWASTLGVQLQKTFGGTVSSQVRFATQPLLAFGTAFIVAPQVIATTAH